jgi:hypothetical protein
MSYNVYFGLCKGIIAFLVSLIPGAIAVMILIFLVKEVAIKRAPSLVIILT